MLIGEFFAAVPPGVVCALVLGFISLVIFSLRLKARQDANDQGVSTKAKEPEPSKGIDWGNDRVFTAETLEQFDGKTQPLLYLAACGKVFDCSESSNIGYNEGYGKLWAGKDATYALATLSLKPEDANIFKYALSDLNEEQIKVLAGWYKHFTSRYKIVGVLKEYEGWDFSSVYEEAKMQEMVVGSTFDGSVMVPSPAEMNENMFHKGDRVVIIAANDFDLVGEEGEVTNYVPTRLAFAVRLDGNRGTKYVSPSCLALVSELDYQEGGDDDMPYISDCDA